METYDSRFGDYRGYTTAVRMVREGALTPSKIVPVVGGFPGYSQERWCVVFTDGTHTCTGQWQTPFGARAKRSVMTDFPTLGGAPSGPT